MFKIKLQQTRISQGKNSSILNVLFTRVRLFMTMTVQGCQDSVAKWLFDWSLYTCEMAVFTQRVS